ncbi:MAG: LON peptidase substrate-binding domain-containing protein [Rhodothermales bacterium]
MESLPLFPLGVVLYPNEQMPLHIFEPRYQDLVAFCLEYDQPFGVVMFDEGDMADVGCTARIEEVTARYEEGKMDIMVRGERRFLIKEVKQERTYLTASVERMDDRKGTLESDLKERAITQHMKLLELAGRTVRPSLYQGVEDVSYVMAHNAGLTLRQKQKVLELADESERIAFLVEHFEHLIPRVEQIEDVRRKIQSNGHFRDFPPEATDTDTMTNGDE